MMSDVARERHGAGRLAVRLLVFALLGPPLGAATMLAVVLPLIAQASSDRELLQFASPDVFFAGLPAAYLLGAGPALLTGAIDGRLAARDRSRMARAAVAALTGGLFGLVPIVPLLWGGYAHGPLPFTATLCGAVAGGLCSLVCSIGDRRTGAG